MPDILTFRRLLDGRDYQQEIYLLSEANGRTNFVTDDVTEAKSAFFHEIKHGMIGVPANRIAKQLLTINCLDGSFHTEDEIYACLMRNQNTSVVRNWYDYIVNTFKMDSLTDSSIYKFTWIEYSLVLFNVTIDELRRRSTLDLHFPVPFSIPEYVGSIPERTNVEIDSMIRVGAPMLPRTLARSYPVNTIVYLDFNAEAVNPNIMSAIREGEYIYVSSNGIDLIRSADDVGSDIYMLGVLYNRIGRVMSITCIPNLAWRVSFYMHAGSVMPFIHEGVVSPIPAHDNESTPPPGDINTNPVGIHDRVPLSDQPVLGMEVGPTVNEDHCRVSIRNKRHRSILISCPGEVQLNTIQVKVNGALQQNGSDYSTTPEPAIIFSRPLKARDIVDINFDWILVPHTD